MLVTIPVVMISMGISLLAAYALSRLGFAGRRASRPRCS